MNERLIKREVVQGVVGGLFCVAMVLLALWFGWKMAYWRGWEAGWEDRNEACNEHPVVRNLFPSAKCAGETCVVVSSQRMGAPGKRIVPSCCRAPEEPSAAPTLRDCNKKDWHCDFRGWPEMLQKHTSVQVTPPKVDQTFICWGDTLVNDSDKHKGEELCVPPLYRPDYLKELLEDEKKLYQDGWYQPTIIGAAPPKAEKPASGKDTCLKAGGEWHPWYHNINGEYMDEGAGECEIRP